MSNVAMVEKLLGMLAAGDDSVLPVLEDAILEGVADAPKGVSYVVIERKAWTRFGTTHAAQRMTGHFAVVAKNKSIRLVGAKKHWPFGSSEPGMKGWDRTFAIGDTVEESSYNLTYFGTVVSISDKKIGIAKTRSSRKAMQDLAAFSSRNHDLDVAAAAKRNSEWMD